MAEEKSNKLFPRLKNIEIVKPGKETMKGFLVSWVVVFALLALVLFVSQIGSDSPIFAQQTTYDISWNEKALAAQTGSVSVSEGAESETPIQFAQNNLTKISFKITWTDSYALAAIDPASVTVVIYDNAGKKVGEKSGSDGAAGIDIIASGINPIPTAEQISGKSESDARQNLNDKYPPATNGIGTWKIVISESRQIPSLPPTGISASISAAPYDYEPKITEHEPSGEAQYSS